MTQQGHRTYRIIYEYRDAWKPDLFRERYSEVLDRYDFIVGDWGYNQLRLRGFYKDDHPKATKETSISSLQDYLQEYCNFGCAYFVIERVDGDGENWRGELPPTEAITITELPATDRYADWQAFKQRLQEERQQQAANGEDHQDRHDRRARGAQGNANGQHNNRNRRGGSQDQVRQEMGEVPQRQAADGQHATDGQPRQRPGTGRHNRPAGSGRRHAGRSAHQAVRRQDDRRDNGNHADDHPQVAPGRDEGHQADRSAERNRGGQRQVVRENNRQEQDAAAQAGQEQRQQSGRPGKPRHWNRNRKNRHGSKDKPHKQESDNRQKAGQTAGDRPQAREHRRDQGGV